MFKIDGARLNRSRKIDPKFLQQSTFSITDRHLMKPATNINRYSQFIRHHDLLNAKTPGIIQRLVYLGSHDQRAGIIHGRRSGRCR